VRSQAGRWVLNAEMDHHLEAGEPDGRPNGRSGYGAKTVLTGTGKLELRVPHDRLASFEPQLIAKYQRRFPGFDEKIVSMYARGMVGYPTESAARWGAPHARDAGPSARTRRS
jgi:transposase-like protein